MNLNEYFKKYKLFKKVIIVISVRDEASKYIKNFTESKKLGITADLSFRDSYIAVIDKKRKFFYEEKSQKRLQRSYKLGDDYINIISSGFNDGPFSSIKINDMEYSFNKTGLNIAIFDNKTLQPIDKFYVSTYSDGSLQVRK